MMKKYLTYAAVFAGLTLPSISANAQNSGTLDAQFDVGTGANNVVNCMEITPDDKIILGGDFSAYNTVTSGRITKLTSTGTFDPTFSAGSGFNNEVHVVKLLSTGKILVGGAFTQFNGTSVFKVARLNANGSLDNTFNCTELTGTAVLAIHENADGTIFLGGAFDSYNSNPVADIVKVDADGNYISTFNAGTTGAGVHAIRAITVRPSGKVVVGGTFVNFNDTVRNGLIQLNADGTRDLNFNATTAGLATSSSVWDLETLPNGEVLAAGTIYNYNGVAANGMIQIAEDGTAIHNGQLFGSTIYSFDRMPNGKYLVGGFFSTNFGSVVQSVARLNSNLTVDQSFKPISGASATIYAVKHYQDTKALVAGDFQTYDGVSKSRFAMIYNCNINSTLVLENDTLKTASIFTPNTGFTWYNCTDNQIVANETDSFFVPTMPGIYAVDVQGNGCSERSVCLNACVLLDNTITATTTTLTVAQAGATYQWFNCATEEGVDGATGQSFSPTDNVEYGVRVIINGCTSFSTCAALLPSTSITDETTKAFTYYPNPAFDVVQLKNLPLNGSLSVTDIAGKVVAVYPIQTADMTLDVSGFSKGMYLITATAPAQAPYTVKVMVR